MLPGRPIEIVLERVVVEVLGERARVGAAPLRRRVRARKRDLRERRIRFSRRQPPQPRLDRVAPVDRGVEDRHRQAREPEARLIHPARPDHVGVFDLGAGRHFLDQPRFRVRQRQRRLEIGAAAILGRLAPFPVREENRELLPRRQLQIELAGEVVVVESDRQRSTEVVALESRRGRRGQERLEVPARSTRSGPAE